MKKTLKKVSGRDSWKVAAGSGFRCYCPQGTTYAKLVRLFGAPSWTDSEDGKVQAQWVLVAADGSVATIYDYKEYGRSVHELKGDDWHIGGRVLPLAKGMDRELIEALHGHRIQRPNTAIEEVIALLTPAPKGVQK